MAGHTPAGGSFYCVIPAGGSGTRLWPISRSGHPKFLHALTGSSDSLLQATAARLSALSAPERIYVVTGAAHATAVARQLPELPDSNVLVEPSPRDSCAAIGLAAALIARSDPDAIMGSFAADHLVRDQPTFVRTIRAAATGARRGWLMTVGITPTRADTGYGYLRCGGIATGEAVEPIEVAEFKEKPSAEAAAAYVASGRYLWNAGMFVWRVDVFLDELRRQQPALFDGLTTIAAAWGDANYESVLAEVWPELPKISVDHAVMEGAADAGRVATVPGNFGWADIGDFDTLGEVLIGPDAAAGTGAESNVVVAEPKEAPVLMIDTSRTIIVGHSGRLIAALGVEDLIVVDTPDALLICARDRAQDIKTVVDQIKARGEDRYL